MGSEHFEGRETEVFRFAGVSARTARLEQVIPIQ